MRFNIWKQVRLAGCVILIVGSFFRGITELNLLLLGFMFIGTGVINGQLSVENRLDQLEDKLNGKDKTE